MSLEHAILGFLNYKSFSGYDLKKIFDTSVRHFWSADQSQIYRTLSRLEERELAGIEIIKQENRPDRKEYHITEAGRKELRRWLLEDLHPGEPRSVVLVQLFFSAQLSDEEVLAFCEKKAQQLRHVLEIYRQVPQQVQPFIEEINSDRETFFWLLTLENGIYSMKANLNWIESVIDRVKEKRYVNELGLD